MKVIFDLLDAPTPTHCSKMNSTKKCRFLNPDSGNCKLFNYRNPWEINAFDWETQTYKRCKACLEAEFNSVPMEDILEEKERLATHNLIFFNTFKNIIEKFESEPLDEKGNHNLYIGKEFLDDLKDALKSAGYDLTHRS